MVDTLKETHIFPRARDLFLNDNNRKVILIIDSNNYYVPKIIA